MRPFRLLAAVAAVPLAVSLFTTAACGPVKDRHVDGECMLTCKTDPQRTDAECQNECTECVAGPNNESDDTDDT